MFVTIDGVCAMIHVSHQHGAAHVIPEWLRHLQAHGEADEVQDREGVTQGFELMEAAWLA